MRVLAGLIVGFVLGLLAAPYVRVVFEPPWRATPPTGAARATEKRP